MAVLNTGVMIDDLIPSRKIFHGLRIEQAKLKLDTVAPNATEIIKLPQTDHLNKDDYQAILWADSVISFSITANGHLRMIKT